MAVFVAGPESIRTVHVVEDGHTARVVGRLVVAVEAALAAAEVSGVQGYVAPLFDASLRSALTDAKALRAEALSRYTPWDLYWGAVVDAKREGGAK